MGTRLTVPCPVCGRGLSATIDDFRMERTVWCSGGHNVKLVDQGNGAQKLKHSMDDLDKSLKKLGIKLRRRR